jgi:hypothetical protein
MATQHDTMPAISNKVLQVKQLTENAVLLTQATKEAAGYDAGTSCQVLLWSGLFKHNYLEVKTGTIDRDYTGNIAVVLQNNSDTPYNVTQVQQIAQLVIYQIAHLTPMVVEELHPTHRGQQGFGSTGNTTLPKIQAIMTTPNPLQVILQTDNIKPYNIGLSQDLFHKCLGVSIPLKGSHPTLGLITAPTPIHNHRLQLIRMVKSKPANWIPRWHSTL